MKHVRFGNPAFLQQNGACFGPEKVMSGLVTLKFGSLLCEQWSDGTFGSVSIFVSMIRGPNILALKMRKCVRFPSQSATSPVFP